MTNEIEIWDGRLIAAARALAGMTVRDLAAKARTGRSVISDLEQQETVLVSPTRRHGFVSRDLWGRIIDALQASGVEIFQDGDGVGAGVRWVQPRRACSDALQMTSPDEAKDGA